MEFHLCLAVHVSTIFVNDQYDSIITVFKLGVIESHASDCPLDKGCALAGWTGQVDLEGRALNAETLAALVALKQGSLLSCDHPGLDTAFLCFGSRRRGLCPGWLDHDFSMAIP